MSKQDANGLRAIRQEIDAIDSEMVNLFKRRLEIVERVAAAKRATGSPVLDPGRERAILTKVSESVGPEYENGAQLLFSTLFGISRARQRAVINGEPALVRQIREVCASTAARFPARAVVACPGVEGSYAQQACSRLFTLPTILFFNGFDKIFDAVESGLCPYGILPIENSAAGSVTAVYDLMDKHRFHIVRALRQKVDHVLLGVRGASLDGLREVASHPHALAQCGNFLKQHSAMKPIPESNTAVAAKALAQSGRTDRAVVASRACAKLYGLEILEANINKSGENTTRFAVLSRVKAASPAFSNAVLMFTVKNEAGSLAQALNIIGRYGCNMTALRSRPLKKHSWQYYFYVEIDSTTESETGKQMLSDLSKVCDRLKVAGAFAPHVEI